jgi:hypothetical protein
LSLDVSAPHRITATAQVSGDEWEHFSQYSHSHGVARCRSPSVVRAAWGFMPALDCRLARRVQPLLIVIGSDTAHMLARSDRPDTIPPSQNRKEEQASRFRRMSAIGKSGRDSRHRVSVAIHLRHSANDYSITRLAARAATAMRQAH